MSTTYQHISPVVGRVPLVQLLSHLTSASPHLNNLYFSSVKL